MLKCRAASRWLPDAYGSSQSAPSAYAGDGPLHIRPAVPADADRRWSVMTFHGTVAPIRNVAPEFSKNPHRSLRRLRFDFFEEIGLGVMGPVRRVAVPSSLILIWSVSRSSRFRIPLDLIRDSLSGGRFWGQWQALRRPDFGNAGKSAEPAETCRRLEIAPAHLGQADVARQAAGKVRHRAPTAA